MSARQRPKFARPIHHKQAKERARVAKRGGFRRSQCSSGKIRWSKRGDAQQALNKIGDGPRLTEFTACAVYHCPHCDGWHLTSQAQR